MKFLSQIFLNPPTRFIYFLGFLICLGSIFGALYFQYVLDQTPCALCILQRVGIILAGIFYFLFFLINFKNKNLIKVSGLTLLICTVFGLSMAIRQIYLQHLPLGQAPACGPGIGYLFQALPLKDFFLALFQGDGECAKIGWSFLGLSLAEYSAGLFLLLSLLNIDLISGGFYWLISAKMRSNTRPVR